MRSKLLLPALVRITIVLIVIFMIHELCFKTNQLGRFKLIASQLAATNSKIGHNLTPTAKLRKTMRDTDNLDWIRPYQFKSDKLSNGQKHCRLSSLRPSFTICMHPNKIDKFVSGNVRQSGKWEPHISVLLAKYLKEYPDATFIDLGANIGAHALYAAALGRQVLAVEASYENWPLLEEAVVKNQFQSRFTLLPFAISENHTQVTLSKSHENLGNTYVVGPNETVADRSFQTTVRTIQLDDLLPFINSSVAVVKIDVEHHECYVIRAGKNFFKRIHVPYILMEWWFVDDAEAGQCRQDMIQVLKESGFEKLYDDQSSKDPQKKYVDVVWGRREVLTI